MKLAHTVFLRSHRAEGRKRGKNFVNWECANSRSRRVYVWRVKLYVFLNRGNGVIIRVRSLMRLIVPPAVTQNLYFLFTKSPQFTNSSFSSSSYQLLRRRYSTRPMREANRTSRRLPQTNRILIRKFRAPNRMYMFDRHDFQGQWKEMVFETRIFSQHTDVLVIFYPIDG